MGDDKMLKKIQTMANQLKAMVDQACGGYSDDGDEMASEDDPMAEKDMGSDAEDMAVKKMKMKAASYKGMA